MTDQLYFRQLLAGRDFARGDPLAPQMVNFVYLIGDRETGDAVAVDPAYGVQELVEILDADGLRLRGVLATHWHPDHLGGDLMGHSIRGAAELTAKVPAKIVVHKAEVPFVHRVTGLSASDLTAVEGGDEVMVGNLKVTLVHTPGHTPGSQCFLVGNALVSGDTLFIGSCGRVDLPGSDPEDMYRSLGTLAQLPDQTILFPGHNYADRPRSTIGDEKRTNMMLRFKSLGDFLSVMSPLRG